MRTWKLNDSVPTSAIMASGIHSPGLPCTWRSAARSSPRARCTGAAVRSAAGFIPARATSMATKESALRAKQVLTPAKAMTAPALAGPTIRALWTMTEFSETALTTRSAPTSSMTKLWRVGLSTALTVPRTKTSAQTTSGVTDPPTVSAKSASAGRAMSAWVTMSTRRFGRRSASRPPHAPKSRMGTNCSPAVRPTAAPLPVSCTISHISATVCIQLPETETIWPAK